MDIFIHRVIFIKTPKVLCIIVHRFNSNFKTKETCFETFIRTITTSLQTRGTRDIKFTMELSFLKFFF